MKGSRVQAVVRELSNERIDIVPWSDDEAIFLSRALSPATVKRVVVDRNKTTMTAIVDDDQLSLAIGKSGQNARLAAQLTGWKVDIITETRFQELQDERAATFVPLTEVAGVGKVMLERLEAAGIQSANDLVDVSLVRLLDVPGIGESTGAKIQGAADEVVSVKVQAYREELERQRAEEAARLAEEEAEAARLAEEEAEAARLAEEEAEAEEEAGEEPVEDEGVEIPEEDASVEASAPEEDQVGDASGIEGR